MSELDIYNYKKICYINGVIFPPLLVLLSWPYYYAGLIFELSNLILYGGALIFGLPFTLTILHGIVTVSIGSVQRDYFYKWLKERPYSFGLLFHPLMVSTRFRLSLISFSLLVLLIGAIFNL